MAAEWRISYVRMTCLLLKADLWTSLWPLKFLIGLATLSVYCLAANQPPFTRQVSTTDSAVSVGWFLEERFGTFLDGCGLPRPLKGKLPNERREREISAVPGVILTDAAMLRPADQVWLRQPKLYGITRAFGYVSEKPELGPETIVESAYLTLDFAQTPETLLPDNSPSVITAHSCSSILAMAMNAETGFSFPVATLQAALGAQARFEQQGRLALVAGTFTSPFFRLLQNATTRPYANLLLWEWYSRNQNRSALNKQMTMLASFRGVSLLSLTSATQSSSADFNVDVKLAVPAIIKVNGSTELRFRNESKTEIRNVAIAPFVKDDALTFQPVPTADDIAKTSGNVSAQLLTSTVQPTLYNRTTVHSQVIEGMPKDLCSNIWTVELSSNVDSGVGSLVIPADGVHLGETSKNNLPTCRLDVQYTPLATIFGSGGPGGVRLSYRFVTRIGDLQLKIPGQEVQYVTSDLPKLQVTTPSIGELKETDQSGVKVRTLTYRVSVGLVQDSSDPISTPKAQDFQNVGLICEKSKRTVAPLQPSGITISPNGTLDFNLSFEAVAGITELDPKLREACILTGKVALASSVGLRYSRDLPAVQVLHWAEPAPIASANSAAGVTPPAEQSPDNFRHSSPQ